MLRRLKLRIKLECFKIKARFYGRRWQKIRKKEDSVHTQYKKACTDLYYAVQNMNPEKVWEMRGEREFQKGDDYG